MMYVLFGVLLTIAIILVTAALKPNTVHYERSAVIHASADRILSQISNFRSWQPCSPWERLDPAMRREYHGADRGVGAKYHWSGNQKAGEGEMEIIDEKPDSVTIDLHFMKPWEAKCITVFKTTPEPHGTRLTWTMDGPNTYMGKLFGLFANMDKMIGRDFETGLAGIKAAAEDRHAEA